jgi:hypothetical protein
LHSLPLNFTLFIEKKNRWSHTNITRPCETNTLENKIWVFERKIKIKTRKTIRFIRKIKNFAL